MKMEFKPSGVCSRKIDIEVNDEGIVESVQFSGGCSGNTQGVALLCKGMKKEEVIARCKMWNEGNFLSRSISKSIKTNLRMN